MKDLLSLGDRRRIIKVDNGMPCPLNGLKRSSYNVFPRLRKDLNRHILRDLILLNQLPGKGKLRLRSCRKTDFNLFEAQLHQQIKKLQLFL